MASSKTEICNWSLARIGVGVELTSFDTDTSAAALKCRLFYPTVLRQLLEKFPWPFAQKYVALGNQETDPNLDWGYSFTYPADCLRAVRILSGAGRVEPEGIRVPFAVAYGATGRLIFSDLPDPTLQYTVLIEDVSVWPYEFASAFAWALAVELAAPLAVSLEMRNAAKTAYLAEVSTAEVNATNEAQPDEEPEAASIRSRT